MNAKEFFYDQSFQDYPKPPTGLNKIYQKIMYWFALQLHKIIEKAMQETSDGGPR